MPSGPSATPRWTAEDLVELYAHEGPQIFSRSLLRKLETVEGLIEERYSPVHLEMALSRYMGDAKLSEALTDVLITSYDIQTHEPYFFKSHWARLHSQLDFPMSVVARATSAARPTSRPSTPFPPRALPASQPITR